MKAEGVCVHCATYNHVKYIERTLEGFVSQIVDFPYKVIVHDDASTDGTAEIVQKYADKYPNIIVPILEKENQASKGVDFYKEFELPHVNYRYLAICEGDDYWTDNNKLYLQFHYMIENPDVSLCVHNTLRIEPDESPIGKFYNFGNDTDISIEQIIEAGPGVLFHTSSYMIKEELIFLPLELRIPHVSDYNLALYAATKGRIHYFDRTMSCYRVNTENSWTRRTFFDEDKKIQHYKDMRDFYLRLDRYTGNKYQHQCMERVFYYDCEVMLQKKSLLRMMVGKDLREERQRLPVRKKIRVYKQGLKNTLKGIRI